MKQFIILLKKDLMELFRTKKVLIIGFIFIILSLMSPLITKMTPELLKSLSDEVQIIMPDVTIVESYAQFTKNISQICMYAVIITFAGLIVNERKKGLYTNLVNNGVRKYNFVLSKILSQILVITAVYIVSALLFSLYNYVIFEEFMIAYSLLSFVLLYTYLVFVICCINLFSTISKSNVMSIILGFVTTLLLGIFDLFKFGKYLPNYLLTLSNKIFSDAAALEYVYKNIGITVLLSIIIVITSIKLCSNKE